MDQSHVIILYAVEGKGSSWEADVDPEPPERASLERGLCVAVPGRELFAVPVNAPGEVISRNAAVSLLPFTVNAFAGQADIGAASRDLHLKVIPVQVQALLGQHLPPVQEPAGEVRVGVLPGRGVGDLAVVLLQAKVPVRCVWVKCDVACI